VHAAGRGVAAVGGAHVVVVAVRRRPAHARPPAARVVGGAGVAVIARRRVVGVYAAAGGVAAVVGADVVVVAVRRRAAHTCSAAAGVLGGAGVVVAAGGRIVGVHAARGGVAAIVRAHVAIVAAAWLADTCVVRRAVFVYRALIRVGTVRIGVAAARDARVLAAAGRIASVGRARVTIVAVRRRATHTRPAAAGVVGGAGVAVIARGRVVGAYAAAGGVAAVVGADVAVVAVRGRAAHACPAAARVAGGAGVVVVARSIVVGVHAAGGGVAAVVGAEVAIVAVGRRAAHARPTAARVAGRTGVAVITRGGVVGVHAAGGGVAAVVGTDIAIVAVRRRAAHARPAAARVVSGTGVAVIARGRIVRVHAAGGGVAAVVGTDVAIVAGRRRAAHARPAAASVVGGAGITVVARDVVVDVHATSLRIANVVGTDIAVVTVGRRAPDTRPIGAGVAGGAGVAVAARGRIVGVRAASGRVTVVVGADVAIVAVRRQAAHARPPTAGVVGGAGVAVVARGGIVDVHTATLRITGIVGARVAVVTVATRATLRQSGVQHRCCRGGDAGARQKDRRVCEILEAVGLPRQQGAADDH